MPPDVAWAPEVVEAVALGVQSVSGNCNAWSGEVCKSERECLCRRVAAAALSASPLPEALALIGRLVGADLVELCDKEGDIAADAAAFLARVRG